jgi:hypothetical protein
MVDGFCWGVRQIFDLRAGVSDVPFFIDTPGFESWELWLRDLLEDFVNEVWRLDGFCTIDPTSAFSCTSENEKAKLISQMLGP